MAGNWVYVKEKKVGPGKKGVHWPEKKRMEAVATYLSVGTLEMTSMLTTVPVETLRGWKLQDWWKKYIQEIQDEETSALGKRLSKILDKSLSQVEDRLEKGDPIYDPKTGKIKRIPAKLRDIHKVSADLIDKKQQLLKLQKPAEEKTTQITADHLVQLANAFAAMATGKPVKDKAPTVHEGNWKEVYDELGYEVDDAIHEEREEGLQEGVELGAQGETQQGEGQSQEKLS